MRTNVRNADRLELQKHVLPILVTLPGGIVECIGTGFIIFTKGRHAHLITAAHVIDEIRKIDSPHPKHHLSTPKILLPEVHRFELKRAKPRAIYFDGTTVHVAIIEAAMEMAKSDIALCSIRLNDNVGSGVAFASRFALDTTPVGVEEPIIAIGYAAMKTKPIHTTEEWLEFAFEAGWACDRGKVTAVYSDRGPTGQKGPCFAVDIPFKGGMSGGPVFTWDEKAPYVRGFVMMGEERSDVASNRDRERDSVPFSLAGLIWPLMLMPVDMPYPNGTLRSERCLLDLEKEGAIIDRGRAHDHVKYARGSDLQIVRAHWE